VAKGVAGGNIILQGESQIVALAAARRAVDAVAALDGVITPFPGGVVRSGSKVGSKYKALRASTNEAFCPTLRGRVASELVAGVQAAYEIVINGVDEAAVAAAMRTALHAAAGDGLLAIGAGNYGGKLGKFHFHLRTVLSV
jgi:formylmethanofuran--tetrahydromethanopterin N-formyltransferase